MSRIQEKGWTLKAICYDDDDVGRIWKLVQRMLKDLEEEETKSSGVKYLCVVFKVARVGVVVVVVW